MRDPDRIKIVLENIRRIWLHDPDLRLGQLLMVAVRPKDLCPELFYIEEKDLLKRFDEYSRRKIEGQSLRGGNWGKFTALEYVVSTES